MAVKKCTIRQLSGTCPDGDCIPRHNQRCCLDCSESNSCQYACMCIDANKKLEEVADAGKKAGNNLG
jgi:hypothetical protein